MIRFNSLFGAAICALLVFAAGAQASTITVTTTGDPVAGACPGVQCSLRAAIAGSGVGDTIVLAGSTGTPSVYTLTQGAQLLIGHDLTIQGNGAAATVVDGLQNIDGSSNANRVLKVTAGTVAISGLTFRNGRDNNDEFGHSGSTINFSGGGALFVAGGTVGLDQVGFDSNSAPDGGAVSNNATLNMTSVWFKGNSAGLGGAMFVRSGAVNGTNVTFENNGGGTFHGGLAFLYGGTTSLTNTTSFGNGFASARTGGIDNYSSTLHLVNDTFSGDVRGSLETDSGATTTAENTIIGAGFSDNGIDFACIATGLTNSALPSNTTTAAAITTDLGHNIDEDGHCGLAGAGDQSSVSAKLAPPAANGGAVRTMALLHGSAAIGAANDADSPLNDARGTVRSAQGAHADVGAFEAVLLGAPTATTAAATGIDPYSETLAGTINLTGEAGAYHFIWGTAPGSLTNTTAAVGAGVVSTDTSEAQELDGLSPATTYYYAIVADNATGGVTAANVLNFTTPAAPPIISNVSVESVADTTAKLDFSIDPAGADTTYVIKYGPTAAYGQTTTPVDIGSTAGAQALTATLTGLTPGAGYHFDVVATNAQALPDGVESGDGQFATQQQITGITGSPATLHDTGDLSSCPVPVITWGDSTPASGGTVNCTGDGSDGWNFQLTATHTYATAGHFPIHIDYGGGNTTDAWALISAAPARTLTVTVAGTGAGNVAGSGIACPGTCAKDYDNGSSVTLTATAADGSSFSGWSGACSGSASCELSMTAAREVTATFTANRPPPAPPVVEETPAPPPPPPAVPLVLSCSRAPVVLLDVHLEGKHVVVAGLALPKYAGRSVAITATSKKALAGGKATIQPDGTFETQLPAPPAQVRGNLRYQATIDKQHSVALKLTRLLVITSEKSVADGLRVSGRLAGARKGASIAISLQVSCNKRTAFDTIKTGPGGRFAVTLPRPTGNEALAFYRLNANAGRGTTDSLPVAVRAAG